MGGRVYYWDWDEVRIIAWEEEFIIGIGMRCLLLDGRKSLLLGLG